VAGGVNHDGRNVTRRYIFFLSESKVDGDGDHVTRPCQNIGGGIEE
jgi:hypothetical protein